MNAKERDNLLRWDGKRRGWYEVYFLKWNHGPSCTAAWIRYTLTSPLPRLGEPYCELWGIFFDVEDPGKNFAVKQRHPIGRLSSRPDRFQIGIGEATLGMNACRGAIEDPLRGHSLSWDVRFDSSTPTLYHFPHPKMYELAFPKTKVLAPHLDARFSGRLSANGREVALEDAPGQQEHIWGTQHAHRFTWGHCNTFREDPQAIWEGLDAQVKLGPLKSPHLKLFYLKTKDREHLFNRPLQLFRNCSRWELGHWEFQATDGDVRLTGEVSCPPDRYVGVTYTDPDGKKLWCHNSKVASIRLTLQRSDDDPLCVLTSEHACAMEHVEPKPHFLVPIRL